MRGRRRWVAMLSVTALVACGSTKQEGEDRGPNGVEAELRAMYGDYGQDVHYFQGTVDLNGDGNEEIIVHVVSPMLCGTGGCTTLIFTPGTSGYDLVSKITVTRPPIRVLSRTTNGWRNLLVYVSGGGMPGHNAELRFDGTSYPSNPSVPPAEHATDTEGSEIVIAEFDHFTEGTPLFQK